MKIKKNDKFLDFNLFNFAGGEVGLKLNSRDNRYFWDKAPNQTIIARIQNSNDFMTVAMAKDALQRLDSTPINLFLPYFPYARQDRVCDKGEAFSLQVFANLINSLNFKKVIICDPHSEVTPALINNVVVISQFDLINRNIEFTNLAKGCVLVSPDAGGNKKTAEIAKYFDHTSFVRADKLRDLTNGQIKETIVYTEDFKKQNVCVIDDICDGGRTFIELAKVCKAKNCGKFILYVTHGIFSKGFDELLNSGIDEIWTTNSFKEIQATDKIHVMNIEERFII